MPLYVIHALDCDGALPQRLAHYAAHRAYLDEADGRDVRIVMSGPLVGEDGETMIGSLLVVEAASLDAARAFNEADPFFKAGIWRSVGVHAFLKRRG